MTRPESPLDRAERIGAELRAATQEAAGMLKDLRAAMKEARAQVDEYLHTEVQAALDTTTADLQQVAHSFATDAKTVISGYVRATADQAHQSLRTCTTIDHLFRAVAVAVAEMTVIVDGEPRIDLTRPIDWDLINELAS